MLCLREGVLFTAPMSIASAFTGFHFDSPIKNDGANFSRKVGLIKVVTNPIDGDTLIIGGKTYTFKNTALTALQIKIGNLVTNGDFAAAGASWINYGNWTIDATGALHVAGTGHTEVLDQEWFPTPVVGQTYATSYTVSGRTAGSVAIWIGGTRGTTRLADGTFAESLVAITNGPLEFVPTADFDGKITAVTVTNTAADLKTMTAKAICDRINLDKVTALVTAYQGLNTCGLTTEIALVAESVGTTPTVTPDGVRITKPISMALVLTEAQLENTDYWKKNITTETDVKPTVLVERNSGTDKNFLY
jgi:hypothetical protein